MTDHAPDDRDTRVEIARVARSALALGLVRVKHPPYDVVVGFGPDGAPFALEDACPHSGASLAKGCVRGDVVVCPMHGWEIEIASGRVRTAVGAGRAAPVFEASMDGDEVVVRALR